MTTVVFSQPRLHLGLIWGKKRKSHSRLDDICFFDGDEIGISDLVKFSATSGDRADFPPKW